MLCFVKCFDDGATHATAESDDSEGRAATQGADTLKKMLQQVATSSAPLSRSNPWDGIGNRGMTMRWWGGQPGSERRGDGHVQASAKPSYSRRLTSSTQASRQDTYASEGSSFISTKELTQKLKHTSLCTKEGENLRRLLNSIRQLERS